MKDDLISRAAVLDEINKMPTMTDANGTKFIEKTCTKIKIEILPSAQPVNIANLQPNCNQIASDCISRQAAIKALNTEIIKRRLLDDVNDGMLDEFDTESILKALPSAQPGWIPCCTALPKLNGYYLATIKWGEDFYEVDCYEYDSHYKEWNEGEYYGGTVVAWMPLPKPYREGGQDNA